MHPKLCSIMRTDKVESPKRSKSRLQDILLAASALTSLNEPRDGEGESNGLPRAYPDHDKDSTKSGEVQLHRVERVPSTTSVLTKADRKAEDDDDLFDSQSRVFPERLMDMLSDLDAQRAICWHPSGNAFEIVNVKRLADDVLPRFFGKKKHSKFDSFVRKLYRWGFRQVEGRDHSTAGMRMTFAHANFRRGERELAVRKVKSCASTNKNSNAVKRLGLMTSMSTAKSSTTDGDMKPPTTIPRNTMLSSQVLGLKPGGALLGLAGPFQGKHWPLLGPSTFQRTAISRQLVKMSSSTLTHRLKMDAVRRDLGLGLSKPYCFPTPTGGGGAPGVLRKSPLLTGMVGGKKVPPPSSWTVPGMKGGRSHDDIIRAAIDALEQAR